MAARRSAVVRPRVLVLAGLDPCGGAGLGADARTVHVHGGFPLTVATCLTVQNRRGLTRIEPVAPDVLRGSIRAACDDGPIAAIKVGMLGSPAAGDVLQDLLAPLLATAAGAPLVLDPVLSATAGGVQLADDVVAAVRGLVPLAHVVTPNAPELDRLAPRGADELLEAGARAVLVTGGHADGEIVEDVLHRADHTPVAFRHPRLERGPVHGTGCALATALATRLAAGDDVEAACEHAVQAGARCYAATPASADGLPVPLAIS